MDRVLGGTFRYPISLLVLTKNRCMKGSIQVTTGQIFTRMIDGQDTYGDRWTYDLRYPVGDCFIQVNQWKWDVRDERD